MTQLVYMLCSIMPIVIVLSILKIVWTMVFNAFTRGDMF